MLLIREQDVLRLLPMNEAIRVVRDAFLDLAAGNAQNQPRRRLFLPTGAVFHALAGSWRSYFGTKVYASHAKHGAYFLVMLYDSETARPLALIEANHLGQIRTGAATGVATHALALPNASSLGVIGTGFQARTQVEAIAAVRALDDVRVWSRNAQRREEFAQRCASDFGLPVRATSTAEECVRGVTIVVTATYSKEPVLESAWIQDGVHINAVGSNNPQHRELPPDLIARASWIVVDSIEQSKLESGDLLLAWTPEDWQTARLLELQHALTRQVRRRSNSSITIFKSNGVGLEDIAAAGFVYERAIRERIGEEL
jgi:ornithine cyclodeaminase/alanine dehydrogenase-like protein (mu-crystallin family)